MFHVVTEFKHRVLLWTLNIVNVVDEITPYSQQNLNI